MLSAAQEPMRLEAAAARAPVVDLVDEQDVPVTRGHAVGEAVKRDGAKQERLRRRVDVSQRVSYGGPARRSLA